MATVRWTPLASRRRQVNTITVSGTPAAGNVATVTINSKSITYTVITGDTITLVAEGLLALLRAADDGEFSLITWTSSAAVITATAADAGVPFTVTGATALTVASTGGGATTLTAASVTTNSSPNDALNVLNYSSGALPSGGDTLLIENTNEGIYWNLDALAALTLVVVIRDTFLPTGRDCWIGNPTNHPDLAFREFRGVELSLTGATTLEINLPSGTPAGAFRINGGTAQSAIKITGDGSSAAGQEAVEWRGTHATLNTIEVYGGSLAITPLIFSSTGTALFQTLKAISGVVRLGTGVTVNTSIELMDSSLDTRVSIPTLKVDGESSEVAVRDAAAVATALVIDAGIVRWNSSGAIATLLGGSGATIDFNGADSAVVVGSATADTVLLEGGFNYIDYQGRTVPWPDTDTVLISRVNLQEVNFVLPVNIRIQISPV